MKRLEKYVLGKQEVVIDKVEKAVLFLEVEIIAREEERDRALKDNLSLLEKLGLRNNEIVDKPHKDIVLENK